MESVILSLCDESGNMARPWAQNGYDCYVVDIDRDETYIDTQHDGDIIYVKADVLEYLPPRKEYEMVFGFPPCTNLAVSGARWFKDKGLNGLSEGIALVEQCRKIAAWADAPWMIENPVSTLSTYWREPDYTFHPHEYSNYSDEFDEYTKKTCLWTSDDFVMPDTDGVEKFDDSYIHEMSPGEERSRKRSLTPQGFANAVYEFNSP